MGTIVQKLKRRVRDVLWPSQHENVEFNRALWDRQARQWSADKVYTESGERPAVLGDEWGDRPSVEKLLEQFVFPHVDETTVAAEIGSGGGRVAQRVAPLVKELYCFDISKEMLRHARQNLSHFGNVRFVHLEGPELPAGLTGRLDYVYSFDVFVHLDLHTQWKYFQEFARVLRPGGKLWIHTTNLASPGGWERFAPQERFEVRGHYFVTPDLVRLLAEKAGLEVVEEGEFDDANFYLRRDYLALMRKPETASTAA